MKMLLYTCKQRGELTSEECFKCFLEYETGFSGRPACVKANITNKVPMEIPTQTQTKESPVKKNEAATPAEVIPSTQKAAPKSGETSPYYLAAELLLERKYTDDEIFTKVTAKFPGTTYARGEISVCRSDMNRTGYRTFPKVEKPILRIKPTKVEKPAAEPQKSVEVKKEPKKTPTRSRPSRKKAPATKKKATKRSRK